MVKVPKRNISQENKFHTKNDVDSKHFPFIQVLAGLFPFVRGESQIKGIRNVKLPVSDQLLQNIWQNNCSKKFTTSTTLTLYAGAFVFIAKVFSSESIRRCCYFWQRAGPIVAHYKFADWWMRITKADREKRDVVFENLHNKYSHPSLDIILNLKGLYVKLGQYLSARPDHIPKQYAELFSELQDSVPQWSLEQIETVIRTSFQEELGINYDEVFQSIDPVALGSASIGQVHKATIRDDWARQHDHKGKKDVAVKIMHPGAKQRFTYDFQVFRWLCRVALPSWRGFLDEVEKQFATEFDYRNEAVSLHEVRKNMANSSYGSKVYVPEPYEELCCKEVLVMELLHGRRITDAIEKQLAEALGASDKAYEFLSLRRKELITGEKSGSNELVRSASLYGKLKLLLLTKKCRDYMDLLLNVHGHQIFVDGCWNGDPHAGNFLQLDDGRIGLIDYGQTKRIRPDEKKSLARIVMALADGSSPTIVADAMRDLGFSVKYDDDDMMTAYAKLFFDSDEDSESNGFPTPQHYFAQLMDTNPLVQVPDAAVFVARASILFRGFGYAVGTSRIKTSLRWHKHAKQAVVEKVATEH